jgi:NitT/TauT family transport system ATP-binding protein
VSLISVRNLGLSYGDLVVLERINLEVEAQEFCAIVGASGCGKSSFLRLLLSEERASSGEIRIDGAPIAGEPQADRGVVFQRYSLFPHLTVMNNLLLGLELKRSWLLGRLFGTARAQARRRADAMLEEVGLAAARDRYPAQLSGGMQQRLSIAQAVICEPRVLLLDEPFGALDPGITADMHELIKRLWRDNGMTIFMISHDIQESFQLGTRLLTFDKPRRDAQAPEAYGATITYDIPLLRNRNQPPESRAFL